MRVPRLQTAIAFLSITLAGAAGFLMVNQAPPALAQGRGPAANIPGVYKAHVTANWFDSGTKFWYRNDLRGGAREFILVDADAGTRKAAFDQQRLALALAKAADSPVEADHLPFDAIEFVDGGKSIRFTVK